MSKKDITKLKNTDQLMQEMNFSKEDIKEVMAYKFFYDLIYAIEDQRIRNKLTQENLSRKSGIPRPEVSKILSGKVKQVSFDRILKLITALDMKLELKHI